MKKPFTPNIFINSHLNSDEFNRTVSKTSNTFFLEKSREIILCRTTTHPSLSNTNNKVIYPEVYKYKLNNNNFANLEKIYPITLGSYISLSSSFSLTDTGCNINIVNIDEPQLSYSELNNKFTLTFSAKDGNNLTYIMHYKFVIDENDEVQFEDTRFVKPNVHSFTGNFYSASIDSLIYIAATPSQTGSQDTSSGEYIY
jgi:hypothetical protein